jgi:hypothetical protein
MPVEDQALHQTAVTKLCIMVMFAVVYEADIMNLENTIIKDWLQ